MQIWHRLILTVFGLVILAALAGCASTGRDVDNASARPWGTPRDWEHGLPIGITEGR